MTGASVAGASHPVGSGLRGGNWLLDVAVGDVSAVPPFAAPALHAYSGLLLPVPTSSPFNLHTVALKGGGYAVTYTATGTDAGGTTENVYAQVFDAQGQQIGTTIEINAPNAFNDTDSLLTALPNGDFAVTWQTGTKGDEIDTRVFDVNGNPVSSAQIVALGGNSADLNQTIALSNGGYAVLYQEDFSGDGSVFVGLFNADGTAASAPIEIDSPAAGVSNTLIDIVKSFDAPEHNQIVATADGFAVMWQQITSSAQNVVVRAFNNDGTPITSEIVANGADSATPEEITALGGDNFAVEWGSVDFTVFTRAFDAPNYTALSPVQADLAGPPTTFDLPNHLTMLANGNYVALWDQLDNANPAISNTFIQVYNAQGQVVSASPTGIQVDTNTDTFNSSDQVITLAGGGFAVMWEQLNDTASTEDVFVRIFDASGNAMSAPVLVDVPDDCMQVGQKMIALADGSFDVLWTQTEDTANGSFQNLLFRHVGADGTLLSAPAILSSTPTNPADSSDVSGIFELRSSLGGSQQLLTGEILDDTPSGGSALVSLALQFTTTPPVVSNPDTVIAARAPVRSRSTSPHQPTATGQYRHHVEHGADLRHDTVFQRHDFVAAVANTTLTPMELASLEYTPPATGEFGGQTISYTATDGAASSHREHRGHRAGRGCRSIQSVFLRVWWPGQQRQSRSLYA